MLHGSRNRVSFCQKKGCFQGPVMDQQKQQVQCIMGNSLAAHGETQSLLYTN